MRIFENSYKTGLTFVIFGWFLGGCGGESPRSGEETAAKETNVSNNSGSKVDPLELPQDTRIVPQIQPRKGEIKGAAVATDNLSDTLIQIETPVTSNIKPQIDTLASQALRIQLHSTELFGDAKRERLIAEEVFDQPVFLDYEVPYYKVRVGSFAKRKEAEAYLQKAKNAGYQNAWVVAVKVNIKESQPLYDTLPTPKVESQQGK
jgi:hypothetical protein